MANKFENILDMYHRLGEGKVLNKRGLSEEFGCDERTVQRYFSAIREYFEERPEEHCRLEFSRAKNGYELVREDDRGALSDSEILAVCKILLESRAFVREEMEPVIKKILDRCAGEDDRKLIDGMVRNELFYYEGPHHGKKFMDILWKLAQAVDRKKLVRISYRSLDDIGYSERIIQPLGIIFSEFYFYLVSHKVESEEEPDRVVNSNLINYRVDRIRECTILDAGFRIPYKDKFKEGEFRKRIQFMFGGPLKRIEFEYTGSSLEAVQDRLPTTEIINELPGGGWHLKAEVYGDGFRIWARAQGRSVKILNESEIHVGY